MTDEKRPYRKKRRAELEEQTRLRITESAVELHGTLGPVADVDERDRRARGRAALDAVPPLPRRGGGVRRVQRALGAPPTRRPDLGAWAAIEDPDERLRTALEELYAYYRRTEQMLDNLLRDEALVPDGAGSSSARFHELPRRAPATC